MDLGLKDKVAVIVGGSKGIGFAIAKCFLEEQSIVAICARNEHELEQAALQLNQFGSVFYQVVDATSQDEIETFGKAVYEHYGRIDCWVNCVGASRIRKSTQYSTEEIEWATSVCFNSAVYGCQTAAKYMKLIGKGSIINISSLAARCGTAGRSTLYGPLKAAVANLATTFAAELAAWNIRVNSVLPGFTFTPAVEQTISKEELEINCNRTLLHRVAKPEEIAAPVVFLCSDQSSYITGTSLEVSGGNTVVLNTNYSYELKNSD